MNIAQPIDQGSWPRREHFEYFRDRVPCTYALTVDVDVTALVAALHHTRRKTYIAQIWALASVVNRHAEFRLTLTEDGEPATWDVVHPAFTVLNPERETFANVWAPFDNDFGRFHDTAAELLATHKGATTFFPQGETPANTFDVSSLPWTQFTGFTLQIADSWDHFLPIFTLGRHFERDGRTLLPLAIQMHHAAADGFHTARLLDDFQAVVGTPDWLE
jgi:chloramphenicol O-acetyltransferase type A